MAGFWPIPVRVRTYKVVHQAFANSWYVYLTANAESSNLILRTDPRTKQDSMTTVYSCTHNHFFVSFVVTRPTPVACSFTTFILEYYLVNIGVNFDRNVFAIMISCNTVCSSSSNTLPNCSRCMTTPMGSVFCAEHTKVMWQALKLE